ncbi:MAG: hypothetical protein V4699_00310 [Patescibacteria group bacterium]
MKVLIVGLGNLGMFLVRHFVESGFKVFGDDINFDKHGELCKLGGSWWDYSEVDIVIFALFPKQIEKWAKTVSEIPKKALFVNVTSVQLLGLQALKNVGVEETRIFSFHPLFGPVVITKSGWAGKQIIVTVQPEGDERASLLLKTFRDKGVTVDTMSPPEHDMIMLPHALAFLIAELVKAGTIYTYTDPRFLTGSGRHMLGLLDFTEACSLELRNLILSNPVLRSSLIFQRFRNVLDVIEKEQGHRQ